MSSLRSSAQRRLDDAQLVQSALRIDNPESIVGYTRDKSDPTLSPQIVAEYDVTPAGGRRSSPDGPWLWCSYCQKENHWRGVLIAGADGSRYSIGHECATAHYGLSFAGAKSAFADEVRRKGALSRLNDIVAAVDAIEAAVTSILHSEALKALDRKRQEIQRACPAMMSSLATAVQSDTPLFERVTLRDLDAEIDWERREGRIPDHPFTRVESRSLGKLGGSWLVRTRDDCRDRLLVLRKAVAAAVDLDRLDTNAAETSKIVAAVRSTHEAYSATTDALSGAQQVSAFFSSDNIERLVRWSASKTGWSIVPIAQGIAIVDTDGRRIEVVALTALDLPSLPPFQSLPRRSQDPRQ